MTGDYDRLYSDARLAQTRRSTEAVVPLVLELVPAQSVVDLGSGVGTWLAAFAARGIEDYLGIDGDWVPVDKLEIPRDRFRTSPLDRAFSLDRTFDLAVSLEVGEHLPEHAADALVESLARLAPCVLFSAAVPSQGGTNHANEQWPDYWAERFATRGYVVVDAIRPRIWSNHSVAFWYRQNALLFARPEAISANPSLTRERERTRNAMLAVVHPELLDRVARAPDAHVRRTTARELSLRELAGAVPGALARSVRHRLRQR